jgi:hypothetical protein
MGQRCGSASLRRLSTVGHIPEVGDRCHARRCVRVRKASVSTEPSVSLEGFAVRHLGVLAFISRSEDLKHNHRRAFARLLPQDAPNARVIFDSRRLLKSCSLAVKDTERDPIFRECHRLNIAGYLCVRNYSVRTREQSSASCLSLERSPETAASPCAIDCAHLLERAASGPHARPSSATRPASWRPLASSLDTTVSR